MKATVIRTMVLIVLASALTYEVSPAREACGRCFSQCIDAVNQIRRACEDRCALDCAALFPNDAVAFDACRESCNAVCVHQSEDTKHVCKIIKYPIPAEEP